MKQERNIFLWVFLCGFVIQIVLRSAVPDFPDSGMWANQIQYFLTHDSRVYDFYAAYGHPGTTIIELGILFHVFLRVSYNTALILGMSILISGATAACSLLCFLLYRQSSWWLATALVLLCNRMYINATPPTAVVMPFIVFMVLYTWLLWQQLNAPKWHFFQWGAVAGLAAATRLDISLLVGIPMIMLIWYRQGSKAMLPLIAGVGLFFIAADPFMWYMPVQHITDFARKFSIVYAHYYSPTKIDPVDMINFVWLSGVSFCWWGILYYRKLLTSVIPISIIVVFSITCLLALIGVFSSQFQATRYLFPLFIVWEVFLPLFALETLASYVSTNSTLAPLRITVISWSIIVFSVLTQLLAYLTFYIAPSS